MQSGGDDQIVGGELSDQFLRSAPSPVYSNPPTCLRGHTLDYVIGHVRIVGPVLGDTLAGGDERDFGVVIGDQV